MDGSSAALTLGWTLGFNKDLVGAVHNLCDETRRTLFYVAGHTGVLYDYRTRTQKLLQGHCNPITCTAISQDKRWLATADNGPDNIIIIWDTHTAAPIKTIFNPHASGVLAMDMSPDAMFLTTISDATDGSEQEISLWEWTVDKTGPLYTSKCVSNSGEALELQKQIKFNPSDIRQIVTTGTTRVVFWSWEMKHFTMFSPPVTSGDIRQKIGSFTSTIYLPDTSQAVTGTNDGDVLLWDQLVNKDGVGKGGNGAGGHLMKRAVKLVKLSNSNSALRFICTHGKYFITGSSDGAVRFYDFQFRLIAWFEDLNGGGVTSVSFSALLPASTLSPGFSGHHQSSSVSTTTAGAGGFNVEDFCVGTDKALIIGCEASIFEQVTADQRRGTLLVQGFDTPVRGVAAHPFLNRLAACCESGTIQLWDFGLKRLVMVRVFDKGLVPTCISFDPHGRYLAVGFKGGALAILDADKLTDVIGTEETLFHASKQTIKMVRFSADSSFLATSDGDNAVAIYRYVTTIIEDTTKGEDEQSYVSNWIYLGKIVSHTETITGLEFGTTIDGHPRLVSVGEDRCLVEYDLLNSSMPSGILLVGAAPVEDGGNGSTSQHSSINGGRIRVEQSAIPTTCMFHPFTSSFGSKEDCIIVCNNEYKMKVLNGGSGIVRKTVLSPTFGGPLNNLINIPRRKSDDSDNRYIAYTTHEKVIGIIKLDLDGNPNKTMGLIAHPNNIEGIAASFDGSHLLTAGGSDMTINIWSVHTDVIDAKEAGSREDPYISLIDGGKEGEFYQEIVNYFYYAQLRTQAQTSTGAREIDGKVVIEEIPNLMRALGFYPTEAEVENMVNEVSLSSFSTTGDMVTHVSLPEFIKLYVNHRPVFGIGKETLEDAFMTIRTYYNNLNSEMLWKGGAGIANLLSKYGEKMSEDEINACLAALMGEDQTVSTRVSCKDFAEKILGFEDFA